MAFISEVNFRGGGIEDGEFIEITLGPNDDPNDFVVSVYRNNGTLHTGANIPGGEVNLGTLTGIPDPDNSDFTIYVIPVGVRNAASSGDEGSGIALTDVSSGGDGVISFFGSAALGTFSATEGAANGSPTDPILDHLAFNLGESPQWDIFGNPTFAPISSGNAVLCVTSDTLLKTAAGATPASKLAIGDFVWTLDHGLQPIRWIGTRSLTANELARSPKQRPICIQRNALGTNIPANNLTVSPQHRILCRSKVSDRMFDTPEVLIAANKLPPIDGVDIDDQSNGVDYYHILFDHHEIISADGALIESLLIAEESTSLLKQYDVPPNSAQADLCKLAKAPARKIVNGKRSKQLISRLIKNNKPFFEGAVVHMALQKMA
jgi:hypothetical protein